VGGNWNGAMVELNPNCSVGIFESAGSFPGRNIIIVCAFRAVENSLTRIRQWAGASRASGWPANVRDIFRQ
jgi:hypothetical protein